MAPGKKLSAKYLQEMEAKNENNGVSAANLQEPSVTSSESAELSPWKRAWSVQSIIALLCLVCILLTASATEVMNTVTCDSALEDTRDTMDESTTAIDTVAQSSLKKVSTEMMTYITNGVLRLIDKHMQGALEEAERINELLEGEFRNNTKNNHEWLRVISERLLFLLTTTREGSSVVAVGIWGEEWGIGMALTAEHNVDLPAGLQSTKVTTFYFTPGPSVHAATLPQTGLPRIEDDYYLNLTMNASELQFIQVTRTGLVQMNEKPIFPLIGPISNFIGYSLMSRRVDHSGSVPGGMEAGVFTGLTEIQDFLKEVTLSASKLNPTAVMRAYTVVASTWMTERMAMAGAPGGSMYDQTGQLTGVSSGNSTEPYWGKDPMIGIERFLYRPRWATDATDPYIKAMAIAVDGNYSHYYGKSQTINILVDGVKAEEHFISVERLTFAENGLDWWLTVSIDVESILGDVRAESTKVSIDIAEKKDDVADEVEEKKMLQRGIIIGIGALLVVLSAVTSWYLLRPVKALQRSMELVANMELDNIDIVKSTFYELRLMQRDFSKMIDNLVEFRAYVPSSVLESSGYSGEGGQTVVAPPTGNVAIVFTDIRGSTALWKSSAADMNVAMEIHNEVMRDACVAHKGYEVKTIGDAFMVSFSSAVAAANFALDVQTNLASQKWPSGLDLPEAGLVVRIGINYGATIAEENPVTGRVDYRGSTVNLASRVEAKARPGTVCITTDMYAALKTSLDKVGNPHISKFGTHEIKGLGHGYELMLMVPTALKCRMNDTDSDTVLRNVPTQEVEEPTPSHHISGHSSSANSHSQRNVTHGNGAKRTALHMQKTSVTVAVCRVCPFVAIICSYQKLVCILWGCLW